MDTNTSLRINTPKIVHETIDGETVILNLDSGNYYSLDGIGANIWALVEKNVAMNGIIECISNGYDGVREEMEAAINTFIAQLMQEDLIMPDRTNVSGNPDWSNTQLNTAPGENVPGFVAPALNKYTDMQDLLLLDPIHEVDDAGWPERKSLEEG